MGGKKAWKLTDEQEEKVRIDELKFVVAESEKLLKETTNNSDIIGARATTLIAIAVGVFTALTGFAIERWHRTQDFDALITTAVFGAILMAHVCYLLHFNIKGWRYHQIGHQPRALYTDSFFEPYFDGGPDRKREIELYLTVIYSHDKCIERNRKVNEQRWRRLRAALKWLMLTPLVLTLTYLISSTLLAV